MSSLLHSSFIPALHSANIAVPTDEDRAHGRACVFDDRKRAASKPAKSDRKPADKTSAMA